MTDDQAEQVLVALAGVPFPWLQAGTKFVFAYPDDHQLGASVYVALRRDGDVLFYRPRPHARARLQCNLRDLSLLTVLPAPG